MDQQITYLYLLNITRENPATKRQYKGSRELRVKSGAGGEKNMRQVGYKRQAHLIHRECYFFQGREMLYECTFFVERKL